MSTIIRLLGLCLAVLCISGTTSTAAHAQASAQRDPQAADYRLDAGDKLRIIVFGEDNLTGEFTVSGTGEVAFPLIGLVPAGGRTVAELTNTIREKLTNGYLRDPRVSAEVLNYRPFFILGEVGKPGEYQYRNGLTIMNAVATAGGFTYRANQRKIMVRRAGASGEQEVELRADTPVSPGDTIRVKERFF
jgi:polysaccharide export outer membrane protein